MVDELLSAYPHQLSFSEASMRVMITNHFSPRTRLTMASRLLINEVREREGVQEREGQIKEDLISETHVWFLVYWL